jgi:DnaJ family protein C protein 1
VSEGSFFKKFVFVFLIILTSGLQYMVQRINYKRDLQRIERIVGKAKAAAWGPKMIPVNGKRKVRILAIYLWSPIKNSF